ncbi:hypothetical protein ACS0TY_020998 [Phlomoides rotata]
MVRAPRFENGVKKGAWSIEEDNLLRSHVQQYGHPNWRLLPLLAGLSRLGKSCRLCWMNYLKPGLKRGKITKHEEDLIIKLHNQVGNKWSTIAAKLPGRTDNEVKNHWHAHINKRSKRETRVIIKSETPHEEQSSSFESINYCTTNENPNALGDPYSFMEPYDQTCSSQLKIDLSPFLEEGFFDFELCRNDYMSKFSADSSSDDGMICWNSNSGEIQGKLWCDQPLEEDTYDVVLW